MTLDERLDDWDEAKKIFAAFSCIEFKKFFVKGGFDINGLIMSLTNEQIQDICRAITGEESPKKPLDAIGEISAFLLLILNRLSESTNFASIMSLVNLARPS